MCFQASSAGLIVVRQHLGPQHLAAVRLERERHHAGALAPLLGDQQDAEHRQQEALRRRRDAHVVGELVVLCVRRQQEDQHDQRGDRADRDQQPLAGAGVDHLAHLDLDEGRHRHRLGAGHVQGVGVRHGAHR
jgi:hypothetical protein